MPKRDFVKRADKEKLVGTKRGRLLIVSMFWRNSGGGLNNMPVFNCECDCGYNYAIPYYRLIKMTECAICNSFTNPAKRKRASYQEIPAQFFGQIKTSAKDRKREYTVSKEYIWNLFISQNRKCALSGIELRFAKRIYRRDYTNGNASLDRIDNNKGYIEGNIRFVDKNINMIRRRLDDNDFIWFCRQVSEYNKEKDIIMPDLTRCKEF